MDFSKFIKIEISIHAPAKGATRSCTSFRALSWISIHAPAKGATFDRLADGLPSDISIHAPAKGATRYAAAFWVRWEYFNPRSREGSDSIY